MAKPKTKPSSMRRGSPGRRVRRLSTTQVARRFSDVVNRVRYQNEVVIVERGREPVCAIGPVQPASTFTGADLVALLRSLPSPGTAYLEAVKEGIRRQPRAEEGKWPR